MMTTRHALVESCTGFVLFVSFDPLVGYVITFLRGILAMICRSLDGLGQPGEFPEGQRVLRSAHLGSQVVPRKSPDLRCYLI